MSERFRAVEWMREKRSLTDKEDRELTWPEKSGERRSFWSYPLWQRLKKAVVEPAAAEGLTPGASRDRGSRCVPMRLTLVASDASLLDVARRRAKSITVGRTGTRAGGRRR